MGLDITDKRAFFPTCDGSTIAVSTIAGLTWGQTIGAVEQLLQKPTVKVNDVAMPVIEYKGQRVVTLAMIDKLHERPEKTAAYRFRDNRSHFIEGEDFFELTGGEIRHQSLDGIFAPRTPKGMLLTETGYLMLVKSFTDDLAWQVQRQLVKTYFRVKSGAELQKAPAVPTISAEMQQALAINTQTLDALVEEISVIKAMISRQMGTAPVKQIFTVQEVAKQIGVGSKRLFKLLRDKGMLTANNLPTQLQVDCHRFEVIEIRYQLANGNAAIRPRAYVTSSGVEYIKTFLNAASLSFFG